MQSSATLLRYIAFDHTIKSLINLQKIKEQVIMSGYELFLSVLEGGFEHEGPTTHARSYFVEISIDGEVRPEDHTNQVKFKNGKLVWNTQFVKTLKALETPTPVIISLTMYKHMLIPGFQNGIKLVGSAHISLADLIQIVDKPAVKGKIHLNMRKKAVARGSYLVLEIEVHTLGKSKKNQKSITTKTPFSTIPTVKLSTIQEEKEEYNYSSEEEVYTVPTTVVSSSSSWFTSAKLYVPLLLIIVMMVFCPTQCFLIGL